jgi:signal transduction histidine kinase
MAPRSSRPVEQLVASLIEDVQRRTARLIRPYVALSVVPVTLVALGEVTRGRATVWALCMPVASVVMALALLLEMPTRRMGTVVSIGVVAHSTAGFLHFGPMLGTGLYFALSLLTVDFFFRRRVMVATSVYLVLVVATGAAMASSGAAPGWWPPLSASDWARFTVATSFLLGALGLGFDTVLGSMRAAIANEVTARRKQEEAEAERERALTAALTAQRLETLGELAAGVAHDTNNTLAVIQGALEGLSAASSEERADLVKEGLLAVRNGSRTARRLLGLARRSSEEVGSCDPLDVIDSTVRAIRRVVHAGFVVEIDTEPCPHAAISEAALEQVLLNLLVNARDALGARGRVQVRCRQKDDRVCIQVMDDGPGMSDEVRARAFEPFFTTKARGEGTGLGLTLARRLIEHAGGVLELETGVGRGAQFTVLLPVHTQPLASPPPSAPAAPVQVRGKILVVEDDPQVLRLLQRILQRAGYEVTVAISVAEARTKLASSRHDLLLTDGQLPDGNAGDVLAAYRRTYPSGPVILCTGYVNDDGVLFQVERDSKTVLVHKPFETSALLELAARLLREASGSRSS